MAPIHPNSSLDADEDKQRAQELRELLHTLLRFWWLIVLTALLAGLAAWVYTRREPTIYRSVAVIEIQTHDQKAIAPRDEQELKDPDTIETIIQNFRNRSLMERVGRELSLSMSATFLGYKPSSPVSAEQITNLLLAGSTVTLRPHTRLVDVSFDHRDPGMARTVADALVDQFIAQGKEQRTKDLESQNVVLSKKYEELKNNLRLSEQKLQEYKNGLKSDSLESVSVEDRRNYVEEKLRGLNANLTSAKGERLALQSDMDLVKRAGDDPKQLLMIASIALDPPVAAAQAQVSRAEADLAALRERYGLRWPRLVEQVAQTESAHRSLAEAARSAPGRLNSRLRAAAVRETNLQGAVTEQEKVLLELEGKLIPFRALQREADSDRVLVDSVLQKLKESTLSLGGGQEGNFQVVEPAVSATSLANRRLYIILGTLIGGAVLAAGAVAGLHLLDSSIRTVDSAERLLGLPVLAAIPTMVKSAGGMLTLAQQPGSVAAESFRTLRSSLALLGGSKHEHQVYLFTSAVPGEGKSFVAVNAAIAFSQQGYKTLLVEADLRRPSLAGELADAERLPGIGDYMVGHPAHVTPTPIPHLSLLASGARIERPAELLSSKEFEELVAWMKGNYDRIVIDSAPVNVVSDTLNIVHCASVVCLVIRCSVTPRKVVRRAVELLQRAGVRPDGLVLNRTPKWNGIGYHYDYAGRSVYGARENYGMAEQEHGDGRLASAEVMTESR